MTSKILDGQAQNLRTIIAFLSRVLKILRGLIKQPHKFLEIANIKLKAIIRQKIFFIDHQFYSHNPKALHWNQTK